MLFNFFVKSDNIYSKADNKRETKQRVTIMEKIAKYLLLTVLSVIIIFAISVFACSFIDYFNVDSVEISGNKKYEDEHYLERVSRYMGRNGFGTLFKSVGSLDSLLMLFALRDRQTEKGYLNQDPYVINAKVSFVPPNKVKVEVFEREENFMIRFLEKDIYISKDLTVLGEGMDLQVPEIRGLDVSSCEAGEKIGLSEDVTGILYEIYDHSVYRGRSILDSIEAITFGDKLVFLMRNGVEIILGPMTDMEYKMKCLNDIYYEYLYENNGGSLDLSDKDRKVYCPG